MFIGVSNHVSFRVTRVPLKEKEESDDLRIGHEEVSGRTKREQKTLEEGVDRVVNRDNEGVEIEIHGQLLWSGPAHYARSLAPSLFCPLAPRVNGVTDVKRIPYENSSNGGSKNLSDGSSVGGVA